MHVLRFGCLYFFCCGLPSRSEDAMSSIFKWIATDDGWCAYMFF